MKLAAEQYLQNKNLLYKIEVLPFEREISKDGCTNQLSLNLNIYLADLSPRIDWPDTWKFNDELDDATVFSDFFDLVVDVFEILDKLLDELPSVPSDTETSYKNVISYESKPSKSIEYRANILREMHYRHG